MKIKLIPCHHNYMATDLGEIYRVKLDGSLRKLKPFLDSAGRYRVNLGMGKRGRVCQAMVHRLVLLAFVGEPVAGLVGCHNDGDTQNNRLSNLRWDTQKENIGDSLRHGTFVLGERHKKSKLTNKAVREIRADYAAGRPMRAMARERKVSQRAIQFVCRGETWKHVKQEAV